jgi:hypothetical protein
MFVDFATNKIANFFVDPFTFLRRYAKKGASHVNVQCTSLQERITPKVLLLILFLNRLTHLRSSTAML